MKETWSGTVLTEEGERVCAECNSRKGKGSCFMDGENFAIQEITCYCGNKITLRLDYEPGDKMYEPPLEKRKKAKA